MKVSSPGKLSGSVDLRVNEKKKDSNDDGLSYYHKCSFIEKSVEINELLKPRADATRLVNTQRFFR